MERAAQQVLDDQKKIGSQRTDFEAIAMFRDCVTVS